MVDGNQSNGYVLTSDANGVGSWAASTGGGDVTKLPLTGGTMTGDITMSSTTVVKSYSGGGILNLRDNDTDNNILLGNDSGNYTRGWLSMTDNSVYLQRGIGYGFEVDGDVTMTSIKAGVVVKDITSTHVKSQGGAGNTRGVIINSTNSAILSGTSNTVVIGGQNITGSTSDTVYVPNLNIGTVGGGASVNNLGIDVNGNVVTGTAGGGGATIDPYQDEGNVNSITWDVSGTSTNYEATLTGITTLTMSNVRNGDYGTLIVTQDGTGSRTLTFGAGTHKVVNGGGGAPTLTTTAGATDILSFTYNGTNFYWTVGNDYT